MSHFWPFYPPKNLENQNFEKMKKIAGGIIILHMFTKNHDHMMYASWDVECNRHNVLSFWTIFLPFYPTNNPENQNFEKMIKTPGEI